LNVEYSINYITIRKIQYAADMIKRLNVDHSTSTRIIDM